MIRHTSSSEHLRIADFGGRPENYANACQIAGCVVTAGHVVDARPVVLIPGQSQGVRPNFMSHTERDLAVASYWQTQKGYVLVAGKQLVTSRNFIGENLVVKGFHGPNKEEFEIQGRVIGIDSKGRIIIERDSVSKVFQLGMSGSVVVLSKSIVVGFLVEGVKETKGNQAYLEPAWALIDWIAGLTSV